MRLGKIKGRHKRGNSCWSRWLASTRNSCSSLRYLAVTIRCFVAVSVICFETFHIWVNLAISPNLSHRSNTLPLSWSIASAYVLECWATSPSGLLCPVYIFQCRSRNIIRAELITAFSWLVSFSVSFRFIRLFPVLRKGLACVQNRRLSIRHKSPILQAKFHSVKFRCNVA